MASKYKKYPRKNGMLSFFINLYDEKPIFIKKRIWGNNFIGYPETRFRGFYTMKGVGRWYVNCMTSHDQEMSCFY